jgi:hypothetical protein
MDESERDAELEKANQPRVTNPDPGELLFLRTLAPRVQPFVWSAMQKYYVDVAEERLPPVLAKTIVATLHIQTQQLEIRFSDAQDNCLAIHFCGYEPDVSITEPPEEIIKGFYVSIPGNRTPGQNRLFWFNVDEQGRILPD